MNLNKVIYIMGVSGVGKSTIGDLLSKELGIPYFDGDDFHPKANVIKMSNGIPLDDNDRQSWLVSLNNLARKQLENNTCIIVCSALKKRYRDILNRGIQNNVKWVHLHGSFEQITSKLKKRSDHYNAQ